MIDDDAALVVRDIFEMYRDGYSYLKIAELLNAKGLRPPRSGNGRRPGWIASTIREMLRNAAYIGHWSYGRRQWRKIPGTNTRRPRQRPEAEVVRKELPHLRIIDQRVWDAVTARRKEVAKKYVGGDVRGASPGRRTSYPFSGLLVCSKCQAPMVVIGGSSSRYYRCGDAHKRGTCDNKLPVREAAVVDAAVAKLKALLVEPGVLNTVRDRIEAKLKTFVLRNDNELRTARKELEQVENEIERLIAFIRRTDPEVNPGALSTVASALEAATKKRETLGARVEAVQRASSTPVRAPTPDEVAKVVLDVEVHLRSDPIVAREALRRLLQGGRIVMEPQADGTYRGSSWILSLALVAGPKTKKPRNSFESEASAEPTQGSVYSDGCAGRI